MIVIYLFIYLYIIVLKNIKIYKVKLQQYKSNITKCNFSEMKHIPYYIHVY